MYHYKGQKLNRLIARELILELFLGRVKVKKEDIVRVINQEHSKRGGKPGTRRMGPITAALKNLRDQGLATNQNQRGYWTFKAKEESVEELQDFNEIREVYEKEIIKDLIESADRLQTRANSQRVKKIAEVVNRCHERLQKLIASCEIIEEVERTTKPQPSPDLPMNLTKGD